VGDIQTDQELEQLAAEAEAGVADVLAAYDFAEHHYAAALSTAPVTSTLTYGANTSAD
jgi:hypothetical protein